MDKVYILLDSDREPYSAFASMEAAKCFCEAGASDLPLKVNWTDYPEWSYGVVREGKAPALAEYSILIMKVITETGY